MEILGDPLPRQWRVTLKDGAVLGLWAGSYGRTNDHYTFEILAEAPPDEQADDQLIISGETPSNPQRFLFTVARIPVDVVAEIDNDRWDA